MTVKLKYKPITMSFFPMMLIVQEHLKNDTQITFIIHKDT